MADEFSAEELSDLFTTQLDMEGIAATTVTDGVVIALSVDKLKTIIEIAENSEDGKVLLFIKNPLAQESDTIKN